jgi:hypothetical protein
MKPGDILYSQWGYEQTNVDWYQVGKVSGGYATLIKIDENYTYDSQTMTGQTTPNPSIIIGDPFRRKVKTDYCGDEYVKIKNYARAYQWDGQPKRYSTYG